MKRIPINIFFSTDNNYAVPTYISLYSLLRNRNMGVIIKATILVSHDFSDKNIALLKMLTDEFDLFELYFINMHDSYRDITVNNPHISIATMYRLLIPKIAKEIDNTIEKCVYLDSDTIVEGDIMKLYDIDIENYYIGGVLDCFLSDNNMIKLKTSLGIPTLEKYINAGVLIFNLKKIWNDGVDMIIEKAGYISEYRYNDQDVLNAICYKHIKLIPIKYNAMVNRLYHDDNDYFNKYGIADIEEARKKPIILHYILHRKPWMCPHMIMGNKWWKYVKTQNKIVIKEYIDPFILAHRASLLDRTREIAKTSLIHLGIYNIVRKTRIILLVSALIKT